VTEPKPAESAAQDKHEQKSDSVHHPTEVSAPLAEQEGTELPAKLDSKEKDQEAA